MELFVSQNDDERIHARYPPQDGIQQVHQFYERFVNDDTSCFIHHSFCLF
jgi:hypothetical protein